MSGLWDAIMSCAGGAGSGAPGGVPSSIYGCVSQTAADHGPDAFRAIGHEVASVWRSLADEVDGWFGGSDRPSRSVSLESALFRTAWHLEHRGTLVWETCVPRTEAARNSGRRWIEGDCKKWTVNSANAIWTEANRRALYGPAGAATDPDLMYKGIAAQYIKIRRGLPRSVDPAEVLLRAIAAYGDFLAAHYPDGQRDELRGSALTWEPTERMRLERKATEGELARLRADNGVVEVDQPARATASPWLWIGGALTLAGAATAVYVAAEGR